MCYFTLYYLLDCFMERNFVNDFFFHFISILCYVKFPHQVKLFWVKDD